MNPEDVSDEAAHSWLNAMSEVTAPELGFGAVEDAKQCIAAAHNATGAVVLTGRQREALWDAADILVDIQHMTEHHHTIAMLHSILSDSSETPNQE